MRYSVLAYVITLMRISLRVKRRFPTWQHLVDAGLMLDSEKKIFEIMDSKSPMSKYWMPLVWATNIINRARKQEIIASDHIVQTLLVELSDIRRRLGALIGYDTVCVPLVYTQVNESNAKRHIQFESNYSVEIDDYRKRNPSISLTFLFDILC